MHGHEKGQLGEKSDGTRAPLDLAGELIGDAGTGLGHVDMRIGAKRNQRRGIADNRRRDVGVKIEADDEGQVGADDAAHPAQQLAFAVLEMVAHHGAVQVEINPVERLGGGEVFKQEGSDALEGLFGDLGGGHGGTPGERYQLGARGLRALDEADNRQVDSRHRLEQPLAAGQAGPGVGLLELDEARADRGKGIGFVLEAADR